MRRPLPTIRFTGTKLLSVVVPFAALLSCADVQPEKPATSGVEAAIKSKPVKMPPTNRKPGSSKGIALDDFFALHQSGKALVYDVRDPYFYTIDHVPGAVNWPAKQYDAQVQRRDFEIQSAIKEGKQIVLYCFNLGCPEARNVAKKLTRRDYDVRVLTMGIDSWRDAGLPLESGKAAE